jgi:hypothetical protein
VEEEEDHRYTKEERVKNELFYKHPSQNVKMRLVIFSPHEICIQWKRNEDCQFSAYV